MIITHLVTAEINKVLNQQTFQELSCQAQQFVAKCFPYHSFASLAGPMLSLYLHYYPTARVNAKVTHHLYNYQYIKVQLNNKRNNTARRTKLLQTSYKCQKMMSYTTHTYLLPYCKADFMCPFNKHYQLKFCNTTTNVKITKSAYVT